MRRPRTPNWHPHNDIAPFVDVDQVSPDTLAFPGVVSQGLLDGAQDPLELMARNLRNCPRIRRQGNPSC